MSQQPVPQQPVPQEPTRYRYAVTSKWCGWRGGWGSESDIASHIDQRARDGYRLVRTESITRWWWWLVPRPKIVFIYEHER